MSASERVTKAREALDAAVRELNAALNEDAEQGIVDVVTNYALAVATRSWDDEGNAAVLIYTITPAETPPYAALGLFENAAMVTRGVMASP